MSWKANATIFRSTQKVHDVNLLKALGYNFVQNRNSNLDRQLYTQKYFCIGEYKDITIICHEELTLLGVAISKKSNFEKIICSNFQPEIMLSFGLQGSMNVYGYSLIENNIKIRVNAGSLQGKIYEFGNRTKEEELVYIENVLKNSERFDVKDKRIIESYFGEELVFELSKRFFGQRLDQLELSSIKMRCYTLTGKYNLFQRLFSMLKFN